MKRTLIVAALAGLVGSVTVSTETEARPRGDRTVCEEWRDFYYAVVDGEQIFIEWKGEPYLKCFSVGSRPSNPDPIGNYEGGRGIDYVQAVLRQACSGCNTKRDTARKRAVRNQRDCAKDMKERAEELCASGLQRGRTPRTPIPRFIETRTPRECERLPSGKVFCTGGVEREPNPHFKQCVREWYLGFDQTQIQDGKWGFGGKANVGPVDISVDYDGGTVVRTIGPEEGYDSICTAAGQEEARAADAEHRACRKRVQDRAKEVGITDFVCR